ncbi:MAG: nucleotidyltransferase domain-containing protein [Bacteroidota bacterium]
MTIDWLRENNHLIIFECVSGSKSYGLDTPQSDTDIRGVFIMPEEKFFGLENATQISNESNDIVFYELRRVVELLLKNNPNVLELLNIRPEFILKQHPLFDVLKPEIFLSKLCRETFGNYAVSQIKKAYGLNKKIINPMQEERKSVLDFCYVIEGQGSILLKNWLLKNNLEQENCGLVNIPHTRDTYGLFYDNSGGNLKYRGIVLKQVSNDVALSSIPKEEKMLAVMSFNKDGYTRYCKDYKEYWDWVSKRNNSRYENTISHGKNYDAKNMMHVFRLLSMAEEIAAEKRINTFRHDRDFLFKIKNGEFAYDELLKLADEKIERVNAAYATSDLPDAPDIAEIEKILFTIRKKFYNKTF